MIKSFKIQSFITLLMFLLILVNIQELVPSPPFVTMVLSSSSKPLPFVTAAISLMSFQNSVSFCFFILILTLWFPPEKL